MNVIYKVCSYAIIMWFYAFILGFGNQRELNNKQFYYILSYLFVLYKNMLNNPNHIVIIYLNIMAIILIIICYKPITLICKKIILMF
jgi:hypothetical protein